MDENISVTDLIQHLEDNMSDYPETSYVVEYLKRYEAIEQIIKTWQEDSEFDRSGDGYMSDIEDIVNKDGDVE